MADTNRIQKELREIASDTASGVTVSQHGDSLVHMKGTIRGATETDPSASRVSLSLSRALARARRDERGRTRAFVRPTDDALDE